MQIGISMGMGRVGGLTLVQRAIAYLRKLNTSPAGINDANGWMQRPGNLLLNSATPATQSVTCTAQVYTLALIGTGSVALSGTASGTLTGTGAADLVVLTFTPTAGSVTFTKSGSVTSFGLFAGTYTASQILSMGGIPLTASAASVAEFTRANVWDFGVPQGALAYAATHTAAEFLAQYPLWHLYQDTAGTIPACKITDPVGLCLDTGSGSVTLGPESAPSLASSSGWLLQTGWSVSGGVASVNSALAGTTILRVPSLNINSTYRISFTISAFTSGAGISAASGTGAIGSLVTSIGSFTYHAKPTDSTGVGLYASASSTVATISAISVREVIGNHASQINPLKRPILSGRVNLLTATTTLSTQSIATLAASYKLTFIGGGTVTLSGIYSGTLIGGGSLTFTATAGTLTLTVTGSVTLADFRPANSPTNIPTYQRVTSATDYDTVGFPVRALFDGVDDCLVVPSLDLSVTDKVTVVAGVTKLSDASVGIVCELSTNADVNAGSFYLTAPGTSGDASFRFVSGGSFPQGLTVVGLAAPYPCLATGIYSISGDSIKARVNSVVLGVGAGDQGAGNFGVYPFHIGQRAGTSLPFNGAIQSLAVIGNLLPDGDVQILEAAANAAMGKVY